VSERTRERPGVVESGRSQPRLSLDEDAAAHDRANRSGSSRDVKNC
jgi:hypothetical protein